MSIETIQKFERDRKHKIRALEEFESKSEYLDEYKSDLLNKVS